MKLPHAEVLELFHPANDGTPWVLVGSGPEAFDRVVDTPSGPPPSPEDEPEPKLVLWISGSREKEDPSTGEEAADCLRRGGTVLLFWRSRFLESPDIRDHLSDVQGVGRLRTWTYLLDAGRVLSMEKRDARGLARTSKKDLIRRTVRRLTPLPWLRNRGLPHWHLSVVTRDAEDTPPLWLEVLLDRVSRVSGLDLSLDHLRWIDRTEMEVAVAKLRTPSGGSLALQVTRSGDARRRLDRHGEQLVRLASTESVPSELRPTLPPVLDHGCVDGRSFLVTRWLEGVPGGSLMYSPRGKSRATRAGLRWILALHRHSLDAPVDPAGVAAWGAGVLGNVSSRAGQEERSFETEMSRYLETALGRSSLPTVLGHGDYWLGNLVLDEEGDRVVGVLDWDHVDSHAPPLEDVLHLLFFQKGLLTSFDPIRRLVRLLTDRERASNRRWIANYWTEMDLDPAAMGPAAALYWLRFLERRELQAPRGGGWYRDNYSRMRDLLAGRTSSVLDPLGDRILAGRHGRDA